MTIDPITKPEVTYTEAPASWGTNYIDATGFVCRITLRAENGGDLLKKASMALAFLIGHGCTPEKKVPRNNNNYKGEARQCPVHHVSMKSYSKNGQTWFSHKAEDGSYCYGKNKQEAHYV